MVTYIEKTPFTAGPFVVLVTEEDGTTFVVAPDGGFAAFEDARAWCQGWAARDIGPTTFQVANLRSPTSFAIYCSWCD